MKSSNLLFVISFVLSSTAFAGTALKSSTGQTSPLQHLSCNSTETNIDIEVNGNLASISSEDLPGHYTCTGIITKTGADLNCDHAGPAGEEAPAKFEIHVAANKTATFSFTGEEGFASGNCSF